MPGQPLHITEDWTRVGAVLTFDVAPVNGTLYVAYYSYLPAGATVHTHIAETKSAWTDATWTLSQTPDGMELLVFLATLPLAGHPYAAVFAAAGNARYTRMTGAAWVEKDPGNDPTNAPTLLYNMGNQALFHVTNYDSAVGSTVMRRSVDDGETWTTLTTPGPAGSVVRDIVKDASGRLLILVEDDSAAAPGDYYIFSSIDNGTTWATYRGATPMPGATTGGIARALAPHPSNANRLGVMLSANTAVVSFDITTNDGAGWTRKATGFSVGNGPHMIQLANNRFIIQQGVADLSLRTSDDDGDSWVSRYTDTFDVVGRFIKVSETVLFFAGDSAAVAENFIARSTDGGTTWVKSGALPYGSGSMIGVAYHASTDTLYVLITALGALYSIGTVSTRDWSAIVAGDWAVLPTLGFNVSGATWALTIV